MNALKKAIQLVGGQTALAGYFGISPQSVQQWVTSGRVPSGRVIGIEQATAGKITRHQLRPDLYPKDQNSQLMH